MEVKDYVTALILIATIISSHNLVSRQIRKTKQSEWIEKIKILVSDFVAQTLSLTPNSKKSEFEELSRYSTFLIIMLDNNDTKQEELIQKIAEIMVIIKDPINLSNIAFFEDRIPQIINLTKMIIKEKTKKI